MGILIIVILLLLSTALGYHFGDKNGAIGTFVTTFFLFGLPVIMYFMQMG